MNTVTSLAPVIEPDFISLPLDLSGFKLPPRLAFNYVKKAEFHVTLIGRGHRIIEHLVRGGMSEADACKYALDIYRRLLEDTVFQVTIHPVFFMVEKTYREPKPHVRGSIIVACRVDLAPNFYEILTALFGAPIERPPHHVTLYTLEDEMSKKGIGIVSRDELRACAKPVSGEIFRTLAVIA